MPQPTRGCGRGVPSGLGASLLTFRTRAGRVDQLVLLCTSARLTIKSIIAAQKTGQGHRRPALLKTAEGLGWPRLQLHQSSRGTPPSRTSSLLPRILNRTCDFPLSDDRSKIQILRQLRKFDVARMSEHDLTDAILAISDEWAERPMV